MGPIDNSLTKEPLAAEEAGCAVAVLEPPATAVAEDVADCARVVVEEYIASVAE